MQKQEKETTKDSGRTLKFRAWDTDSKSMFENVSTGTVTVFGKNKTAESKNCVFMQYTGVKDRTGKMIFEGDILKDDYYPDNSDHGKEVFVKVSFDESLLSYKGNIYSDRDGIECENIFYISTDSKRLEVVGNIYENPELVDN